MDILELPDCLSRRLALPTAAQITSQPCSMMGGGPDQEQNDCESQPQPHQYDEWKHPIQIQKFSFDSSRYGGVDQTVIDHKSHRLKEYKSKASSNFEAVIDYSIS
ncbi:hypothetical protein BLNAU_11145 [Blattamonas nauphoetae]|nr:hypothetical protein BLNAU_15732 [Blattamonas nauphoetae]KAK2953885.1 hypothetical protein BLNAU_11145 [Blattamonas nauphoetae]